MNRQAMKKKTVRRLKYPNDILRFNASLINQLYDELRDEQGKIRLEVAAKITSACKVQLQAQMSEMQREELMDHEDRISALEGERNY